MPLTGKDREVMDSFKRRYGKRGKSIFYATMNKHISEGKTPNLPEARRMKAKRRRKRKRRMV